MADEVVIDDLKEKKQELARDNRESKEEVERLSGEIEELKSVEAEMKQRFEEIEIEMEQFEEEKKVLESISARAVELEGEVIKIQEDLFTALAGGDESAAEVAELRKGLTEEGERFERHEKEAESLRKARAETEKRVRDLERKIGVLEVRITEEKSKKLRVEEEMREKCNQKDEEINELQRKVADLKTDLVKDVGELESCKSEKKRAEEALSESEKREMEMKLKKDEVLKKVEEAKKTLLVLNERIMEPTHGVRDIKDGDRSCSMEGRLQWPLITAGSVGAIGLVAATVFVCYSKRT